MPFNYSPEDITLMQAAEDARYQGHNRVEELVRYARAANIRRIGIANCAMFNREAAVLKDMLAEFDVSVVDCKCGKVNKAELLGNAYSGVMCNPAGQAAYLAENQTELNIAFGLCVGHDIVFSQKSQAPVSTLVIKDREFGHHPYKLFEKRD